MRQLFLVFAKLFGLVQLYFGLITFIQTVIVLLAMRTEFPLQVFANLIGMTFVLAVSLGMAWFLLVRTEWIADKLRIQDDTVNARLEKDAMLLVGVKLIGVYVTVDAISTLVGIVGELRWVWWSSSEWHFGRGSISSIVQLGFGVLLMLQSTKVVEMIGERKTTSQAADASDAESGERPLDE